MIEKPTDRSTDRSTSRITEGKRRKEKKWMSRMNLNKREIRRKREKITGRA